MDEEILKVLGGKRCALIGFSAEEAGMMTLTLDHVQAFCRVVSHAELEPSSPGAAPYDVFLLNVTDETMASAWGQPGALEGLKKPLLMIGSAAFLSKKVDFTQPTDFMTTPINPGEVVLRLYHVLSKANSAPASRPAPQQQSVVIADDDATTVALVKAVLQRDGVQCHIARDGGEALQLIRDVLPQAAILDVNMPHLDGFEVLSAARNDPQTQGVSIVLLTSRQQEADVVRGFGLGADDYILKPFSPMELKARLRRLLRNL